jgi:hypothetical protein
MMQNDLDYDRAWNTISGRFWRRRRREFVINFALFVGAHLLTFFMHDFLGTTFFTGSSPFVILRKLGFETLAYTTVNWAILLIIHAFVLLGMSIAESIFRYNVEREMLRDFARTNQMDEKRKGRPAYADLSEDEAAFDLSDEVGETAYRQSSR